MTAKIHEILKNVFHIILIYNIITINLHCLFSQLHHPRVYRKKEISLLIFAKRRRKLKKLSWTNIMGIVLLQIILSNNDFVNFMVA